MVTAGRRARTWIVGSAMAAAPGLGCSFQNFDYLTQGSPQMEAGVDGSMSDTGVDAAHPADGPATSDASTAADTTAGDASDGAAAVNRITNPNFDSAFEGWTIVPPSAEGVDVKLQMPIGTATTPQMQAYELATYSANDAFTVDVSQTLNGLPDGDYAFTGYFNRGTNNQTYLYAEGCDANDGGIPLQVDIPLTTATGWEAVTISPIHVTGGSCHVGFVVDAAATDWLNADGFMFVPTMSSADDAGASDGGAE